MNQQTSSQGECDDPFFDFYDREDVAYGLQPSAELASYLEQCPSGGKALDLGAGAGRDTLALATAGFHVTSVDASQRGLERIVQRAKKRGLADRVSTLHSDVRDLQIAARAYQAIVATTVLDHIPAEAAMKLWESLVAGLAENGVLYIEVHTCDDPGCVAPDGSDPDAPVSETAAWVVNYFPRGELVRMAALQKRLRVLRYEERYEWDYTHGAEHKHGKAVLLATTIGHNANWFGHPIAFPRNKSLG